MHSEYPVLITLGALLVINPPVKNLLERLGIPALIGYILLLFATCLRSDNKESLTLVASRVGAVAH